MSQQISFRCPDDLDNLFNEEVKRLGKGNTYLMVAMMREYFTKDRKQSNMELLKDLLADVIFEVRKTQIVVLKFIKKELSENERAVVEEFEAEYVEKREEAA